MDPWVLVQSPGEMAPPGAVLGNHSHSPLVGDHMGTPERRFRVPCSPRKPWSSRHVLFPAFSSSTPLEFQTDGSVVNEDISSIDWPVRWCSEISKTVIKCFSHPLSILRDTLLYI